MSSRKLLLFEKSIVHAKNLVVGGIWTDQIILLRNKGEPGRTAFYRQADLIVNWPGPISRLDDHHRCCGKADWNRSFQTNTILCVLGKWEEAETNPRHHTWIYQCQREQRYMVVYNGGQELGNLSSRWFWLPKRHPKMKLNCHSLFSCQVIEF